MAEIFKFFNSAPGDERWHYASDFADYFGNVLSSGLLHKNGTPNLQVKVNAGTMQTYVEAGEALIQGYQYQNTTPLFLTHGLPEPSLDRIDRIVLRLDKRNNARFIRLFVKEGVSATNPVPPSLQRDQYVFELSLAQIRLTKNTSSLEPLKLVDERMKEDLCGIVYSLISVPTSVFQQQWDYWFNNKKQTLEDDLVAWQVQQKNEFDAWQAEQEQEFLTWFESIKDILSGDVAANLAARIANLENGFANHIADVSHIKWIETVGGTANAITATIDGLTSYKNGLGVSFPVKSNSTAAMSLNINGLGAIPIKKANGSAFSNGKANGVYTVRYRDTAFILQGEGGVGTAKPEDVVKDKTFTNDEGEQVGTLKVYNSGEKIPTSKVTAGWRSQWVQSPATYGGSYRPVVDKDGNLYMINGPDNRNGYTTTLVKYSKTGTLIKQVTVGSAGSNQPSGLSISPNGNHLAFTTGGMHSTNIQLYTTDLNPVRAIPMGNGYTHAGKSVAVTDKGDVYIILRKYNSESADGNELKKYANAGYQMWVKLFDRETLVDLILLSDGNVAVATDYGGMKVHKIAGTDSSNPLTMWSYLTHANATNMGNIVEMTNGDVAVSYALGTGDGRRICYVQAIMTNGSARPGSYISLGGRLGTQYMGVAILCSDGNGGLYFGFSGGSFYWGTMQNVTLGSPVKFLIYGRLLAGNLDLGWCHINTQNEYAYSDSISAIIYDPLTDSVISTHSDGPYGTGTIRKWDWFVSLK